MPAESTAAKGRRLLTEGRLRIRMIGNEGKPGWIVAECRGDSGQLYVLGFNPDEGEWKCTCPARTECSHLVALRLVIHVG